MKRNLLRVEEVLGGEVRPEGGSVGGVGRFMLVSVEEDRGEISGKGSEEMGGREKR